MNYICGIVNCRLHSFRMIVAGSFCFTNSYSHRAAALFMSVSLCWEHPMNHFETGSGFKASVILKIRRSKTRIFLWLNVASNFHNIEKFTPVCFRGTGSEQKVSFGRSVRIFG